MIKNILYLLIALSFSITAFAAEMVTVKLKKLDGSIMTKEVEKPRYGGVYTESTRREISSWKPEDPGHISWALQLPYQRLFQADWARGPSGTGEYGFKGIIDVSEAAGLVVESWEQPGLDHYILKIRKGLYFHNKDDVKKPNEKLASAYGRELDAYDVEYSWEKSTNRKGNQPYKFKALDKWTIKVSIGSKDASLMPLHLLGASKMVPREIEGVNMSDWQNAVGTGPFIPTDLVEGSVVTYKKNPNFSERDPIHPENQLPYVDTVRLVTFQDDAAMIAALQSGKIDRIASPPIFVPANMRKDIEKSNPGIGFSFGTMTQNAFAVRTDFKDGPWSKLLVRQALMMATPHEEILNEYHEGNGVLYGWPTYPQHAPLFVPFEELPTEPRLRGSGASVRELFEYHPEKAKKLLAEAGYPDGFTFELITPPEFRDFSELYAGYWEMVGMKANIKVVESAVYSSMAVEGKHQSMISSDWGNAGHPFFPHVYFYDPKIPYNYSRVEDEHIIYEWDQLKTITNREEFVKKFNELSLYIMEQTYMLAGVPKGDFIAWQPWVKNYHGAPDLRWDRWHGVSKVIWLDQDLKEKITGNRD